MVGEQNRGRLPKSAPWQYADVPLDEPKYDSKWSADEPKLGCVVNKINEFRLVVKDKARTVEDQRFTLRFLIYCIEDTHQPCHVGDTNDKDGNRPQVRFFEKGTNTHRRWDSDMIEQASKREEFWLTNLAELDPPESRAAWTKGTVEEWATESLLAAGQAYEVPETGQQLKPGRKLRMPTWRRIGRLWDDAFARPARLQGASGQPGMVRASLQTRE